MEKTAAMNKLAFAVREYVQAEAQFNKVAAVAQQYAMEKNAQNILQRLGLQAAPVKSNMGRNAALAALLLGGAGAGAYGMMGGGDKAEPSLAMRGANEVAALRKNELPASIANLGSDLLNKIFRNAGSGAGDLQELINQFATKKNYADYIPDLKLKGDDAPYIKSLTDRINPSDYNFASLLSKR